MDRVPQKLWTEVRDIVQEAVIKTIPKKKKGKKAKWLFEEALQMAEKRQESKGEGEKERYTHLNVNMVLMATENEKFTKPRAKVMGTSTVTQCQLP